MTTPITSADFAGGVCRLALAILVMTGFSAFTSPAGLSWRSPLNAACRILPPSVKPANSISATSSGFSQCTSRVLRGASLPPNGTLAGGGRLQRRHDTPHRVLPVTGADQPDKGEMTAAIDTRHQRAEFAVGGFPAAQHDLMAGAAFCLGPVLGTAGLIGRTEFLGDDAFQRQLACRFQDGIAARLKVLDIADQSAFALGARLQQFFQLRLALAKRQPCGGLPPRQTAGRTHRR